MATPQVKTDERAAQTSLSLLQGLLGDFHPREFRVRLWDGSTWEQEPGWPARFTLVLKHPGALRRMFWPPSELALGEAYLYDDFDIEGDIVSMFGLADHVMARPWGVAEKVRFGAQLLSLPADDRTHAGRQAAQIRGSLHSQERDQQAISYHYDVSNEFYSLFLDRNMVYSCAYFSRPDEDLDTAQERKLDYICRKLRLQAGERLLDIGCGWGGLARRAAEGYGARVLGITLSKRQVELAQQQIQAAGLCDCSVQPCDYRAVEGEGTFDKLVSVGMFEHVGEEMLPEYFTQAYKLLKPGGAFLNHGIALDANLPPDNGPTFSDRYVFPDGQLLPISTTLRFAEQAGFEVRDVESLREHYALTLENWVRRLEAHHDEAVRATDEVTYRVWRLYMAGSVQGFRTGRINVYQTLLAKRDAQGSAHVPLMREDWYR